MTALRDAGPERAETLRRALVPVVQGAYPDAAARLADLERLAAAAAEHGDLRTFVVELALDPPRSTGADAVPPGVDEDWLVLSTVHSAKGLEWDAVHLLHVTEGSFPSDMGVSTRTVWTRSAGCSTSRSPGPATRCTCTRRCATTTTRGPGTTGTRMRPAQPVPRRGRARLLRPGPRGAGDRAGRCARRLGDRAGPHGRGGARRALGLARVARRYVELEPDRLAEAAVVRLDAPPVGQRLDQV